MSRSIIPRLGEAAQKQIRKQLTKEAAAQKAFIHTANPLSEPRPRKVIEFTMPIPPSVNHLFMSRGNKRVKTPDYAAYMDRAMQEIVFVQKVPHLSGEVAIFAEIRRFSDLSDLDNRLKGLLDAIVASRVIDDDKHIIEIGAKWSKTVETCKVRIEPR